MSAFGGLILTNRGRALQAKAQAGVQLKFTSIRVGDGQVGGQAISELTDLIHTVKTLDITKLKTLSGGKAVVGGTLSNSGLTTGFYWREIGVFAEDPDLGEILYCYGNAGDQAEYIPADGGADLIEKSIDVVILVGNASNISAIIDQSLIFVSMGDFLEHTGNTIAHVTQEERETWNAKETPAGAQAKADAAETNAKAYADNVGTAAITNANNYTDQEVTKIANNLASHKNDNTPHREAVSIERKNPDDDGIFTLIEFKRADGTLFKTSQLNGTSPYTTRTVKFYDEEENLVQTIQYSITYSDDEVVSEVIISA